MRSQYYIVMLLRSVTLRFLTILMGIASFLAMTEVRGQGLDASPAGVMISHGHPKGGWMFSYTYMSMTMKDNMIGTDKVDDDYVFNNYLMSPQKMRMDMHMLMGMYGLTGKLSAMVMANYQVMTMDMKMMPGAMHMHGTDMSRISETNMSSQTSGLGDVKVYGIYKLLTAESASLALIMGVNIPTGSINLNGGDNIMYEGQRLPYMMQLGTGSFDLLPGITYLKVKDKVSWSAQLLSAVRPFDNANSYHYGNELTVNGWAAYKWTPHASGSVRVEGYTAQAIQGIDPMIVDPYSEPSANPNNYGGQRVSGFLGLNIYLNNSNMPNGKISVEYGIPFYQNLNGPQLATQSTFNLGLSASF